MIRLSISVDMGLRLDFLFCWILMFFFSKHKKLSQIVNLYTIFVPCILTTICPTIQRNPCCIKQLVSNSLHSKTTGLGCQGRSRGIIPVNLEGKLGAILGSMLDRADWHCPWANTPWSPDWGVTSWFLVCLHYIGPLCFFWFIMTGPSTLAFSFYFSLKQII